MALSIRDKPSPKWKVKARVVTLFCNKRLIGGQFLYKISEAAKRANLPVKTVRYYGNIGLVVPAGRSESGYRLYMDTDVAKLSFVGRARRLVFRLVSVVSC